MTIDINRHELLLLHTLVADRAADLRKHVEDTPGELSLETAREIEELETLARKLWRPADAAPRSGVEQA